MIFRRKLKIGDAVKVRVYYGKKECWREGAISAIHHNHLVPIFISSYEVTLNDGSSDLFERKDIRKRRIKK